MTPDLFLLLLSWLVVSVLVWAFAGDRADAAAEHTYWTETTEAE